MIRKIVPFVLAMIVSVPAWADVAVKGAHAFATATGAPTGAVFAVIESDMADRLIGVETSVSPRPEIHTHLHEDGVMKMRKIDGVDLAAGVPLMLAPTGDHIMLMEMPAPLVEGGAFPATLIFEKAGRIDVTVQVVAPGETPESGTGAPDGHGAHGK